MKTLLNQKIILLYIVLILCPSILYCLKPITIPEIKQWNDISGQFLYNKSFKIIIDDKYKNELEAVANTFAEDILLLKKVKPTIVYNSAVKAGDILLTLDNSLNGMGGEAYSLEINNSIKITGNTTAGAFYGTRSIIQMLKQSDSIQCGKAIDYPDYPERGIMLDNGRKYFTIEWIKNHIKELAYLKMNFFHFHISDFSGFRLESELFPQIQSEHFYTKKEIKEIVEFANQYNIEIIPEIDMPNHMSAILKHFPQFRILKNDGEYFGDCCIDFTKTEAREFIAQLFGEYFELFPGRYWHLGVDEFINDYSEFSLFQNYAINKYGKNAKPKDALVDFINWADSLVKTKNKTLRIWNDIYDNLATNPMTIDINKDVIIEFWKGNADPQLIAAKGHRLFNVNSDYLYYVIGNGWRPNKKRIHNGWNPTIFEDERVVNSKNNILGAKICIWADTHDALTEVQVAKELSPSLRLLAHRTWNSEQIDTNYTEFENKISIIGLAPGVEFSKISLPNDLALFKKVVVSSQEKNSDNYSINTIDGDYTTRWSSDYVDTAWIYVDLEKIYNITRVKLNWEYSFAKDFQIQVSNDTINWTSIMDVKNNKGGINDFTKLNGSGRYVRIYCTKRNNECGNSLWEFEVYDSTLINANVDDKTPINNSVSVNPNPISSDIQITLDIAASKADVSIEMYDIIGNKVEQFICEILDQGKYTMRFTPKSILNGHYIIVTKIADQVITQNVLIIRQ